MSLKLRSFSPVPLSKRMFAFAGLILLLALICASSALAQAPAAQAPVAPSPGELILKLIPLFIIVMVLFYFLVQRPQEKEAQSRKQLLEGLKKSDMVYTSGGIIGKVAGIENDHILLEMAGQGKLRVMKSHVIGAYERPKSEASSKGKKKQTKE